MTVRVRISSSVPSEDRNLKTSFRNEADSGIEIASHRKVGDGKRRGFPIFILFLGERKEDMVSDAAVYKGSAAELSSAFICSSTPIGREGRLKPCIVWVRIPGRVPAMQSRYAYKRKARGFALEQ